VDFVGIVSIELHWHWWISTEHLGLVRTAPGTGLAEAALWPPGSLIGTQSPHDGGRLSFNSSDHACVRGPGSAALAFSLPLAFAAGAAPLSLFDPDTENGGVKGGTGFGPGEKSSLYCGDFMAFSCTHFGARSNALGSKPSSVSHQNQGLLVLGGSATPRA